MEETLLLSLSALPSGGAGTLAPLRVRDTGLEVGRNVLFSLEAG